MKVLSKSRFKLGLECPNKLYYTGKPTVFPNKKSSDTFLLALANGGFQVEELARMHYPGGIFIDAEPHEYQKASDLTRDALQQENVIIYEAAFLVDGYYIRTDVLVKQKNKIHLIEVKAKSINPGKDNIFKGKRGGLDAGYKPYLYDLAFQKKVAQLAFPEYDYKASFMMADKTKTASIDGMNQLFRVPLGGDPRQGIDRRVNSLAEIGTPVSRNSIEFQNPAIATLVSRVNATFTHGFQQFQPDEIWAKQIAKEYFIKGTRELVLGLNRNRVYFADCWMDAFSDEFEWMQRM